MPNIRFQQGTGTLGARGLVTPAGAAGDFAATVDYVTNHTTTNLSHPLNEWPTSDQPAYTAGDQVIYSRPEDAFSTIYVARQDLPAGNTRTPWEGTIAIDTNSSDVLENIPQWEAVRSGIVGLTGPGDTETVGLPQNATLHFTEGSGVSVTRTQTSFNFALTGTHHGGDVDDFGPGYAYSYFNLVDNTTHSGTVGARQTGFQIDEIENIDGDVYLHIDFQDPDSFNAGDPFAFRTTSGSRSILFPNQADDVDRIIYAVQDSDPTLVYITQVDPGVNTLGDLRTLFNVPSGSRSITPLDFQNLYALNESHVTPTDGVAPWATGDSTATVPGNKLESLSQTPPTAWADDTTDVPSPFAPIADGWLPTDIVRTSNNVDELMDVHYTTAGPVAGERLVYRAAVTTVGEEAPAGWYNEAGTLTNLTDVTISTTGDTALAAGQVLTYDADSSMWVNLAIPESSSLDQGTETVPPRFFGDFVQLTDPTDPSINFVAQRYVVPSTTFALSGGNVNRDLYGTTQNITYTLTITDWDDPDNTPDVIITPTGTGSATYAPNATDPNIGGTITATGFDNTTVNTFSFIVVVTGHAVPNNQRAISYVDNRRVAFLNADTVFDATGGSGYDYAMTTTGNLQVLAGDWAFQLNGADLTGFSNSSGTIPRENANWVLGDNVFRAEGTSNRTPTVTPFVTRTISVRRPYYWWSQDAAPTQTQQFAGIVTNTDGDIVEIAAGMNLMAPTAGNWYLAYPTQMGTLQYRTMRGGLVFTPTLVSGTFIEPFLGITDPLAAERQYTVLEFPGISAGTTFDIETPQED